MPRKRAPNGNGTIYQRKDGRWEGRVTLPPDPVTGKTKRKTIYGKSEGEVGKKIRQITAAVDEGTFQEPSKIKLSLWLDTWLSDYIGNVKPATVVSYEQQIKNHIKPALGSLRLTALQPVAIQKFYNNLLEGGLSPKSIKNVHGVFHRALQQAMRLGYIRVNPSDAVTLPRVEKADIQPLDTPEMEAFLKSIKGHRLEILFNVAIFTGMREGEILGLQWSRVDFARGVIVVDKQLHRPRKGGEKYCFGPPKNDKPRTITPAPFVMQLLRDHKRNQNGMRLAAGELWDAGEFPDMVFADAIGRFVNYSTLLLAYKTALKKANIDERRFHDLRHTYAVTALMAGDDPKTVSQNLGHATVAFTLDIYGHVTATMQQASAARMEAFRASLKVD